MNEHIYGDYGQAESDMLSFSMMNMNEDKTLYLMGTGKWYITKDPKSDNDINLIVRNGQIFRPE